MATIQGTILHASELTWNGREGMEDGYQAAINRTGRAALGAFRSTPTGVVAAESRLAPARAPLDHRQQMFVQQLLVGPQGHREPEEIMTRRSDLTRRLRAATTLQPGETAEQQRWGGSSVVVSKKEEALKVAEE